MTDKIQQARRELFEAWTKSEHGDLTRRQDGEYFDDLTHGAWLGFNAALDCVVIKLPQLIGLNESFQGTPISEIRAQNHYNGAVQQCRAAIESTNLGIKVK